MMMKYYISFLLYYIKVQAFEDMIEKLKAIYFATYGFSFPLSGEIIYQISHKYVDISITVV